jgi:hypothetical protein
MKTFLCLKYADILSDTIAPLPAQLTPSEIEVDLTQWETAANRAPVRPQSVKKDFEIYKALKEILLHKNVEMSNAVYYSHPVIVQRTANTFRFCIDFGNLNGCTKPASWPVPLIPTIFEHIGHFKPRMFGVMNLISGTIRPPSPYSRSRETPHCFHMLCQCIPIHQAALRLEARPYFKQRKAATETVLYGLVYNICEMYIADCIVYADSDAQLLERLEPDFQRFRLKGLRVKAKKCKFGMAPYTRCHAVAGR